MVKNIHVKRQMSAGKKNLVYLITCSSFPWLMIHSWDHVVRIVLKQSPLFKKPK